MNNPIVQKVKDRIENGVSADPMKLSKYSKNGNNSFQRNIYILLVVIPLLLIVSFVFYVIAGMDGKLFGTPDDEIDIIIKSKMNDIIQAVDQETGGEGLTHVGDSFQKIVFALKLVPSMDNQKELMQTMTLVGGPESQYTGIIEGISYDEEAITTQFPYFFEWNGAQRLTFPKLKFDADTVPVGSSVKMCLGLQWATNKKKSQIDKYLDVRGFDQCSGLTSGRAAWDTDYPTRGLNFKIWEQFSTKNDKTCSGGIYVAEHENCYKYKVMKQICILTRFEKDPVKNTYSWVYTGGCYKDNEPVWYTWADPDTTYNFHDIQLEVRQDKREVALADIEEEEQVAADDTQDDDENPKEKVLKPTEKIQREKDSLENDRENGNIHTQGHYMFYRIFIFISGLCLFLAFISVGILGYFAFQLIKGDGDIEGAPLVNPRANNMAGFENQNNQYAPDNAGLQ